MKVKLSILNRFTGAIIFEFEKENNTIAETVKELCRIAKEKDETPDLSYANLRYADLSSANLRYADLRYADLSSADLSSADLSYANLRYADLSYANLSSADLSSIRDDLFIVLLHSIPEIKYLKQSIIEGKIDGSTYDGECACLSGTLVNGAKITDGKQEEKVIKTIMSCRDSGRPIERFFLGIKKGDTPKTNPFSKLALEWVEQFETLIKP